MTSRTAKKIVRRAEESGIYPGNYQAAERVIMRALSRYWDTDWNGVRACRWNPRRPVEHSMVRLRVVEL